MRRILAALLSAILFAAPATAAPPKSAKGTKPPKLVVIIVVDQMRGDYPDMYGRQWTKGLRRLMEHGAWFRKAAYTYMNTITCAGHSTISTGSIPAKHGLILNAWYERESAKLVTCTEDPSVQTISYGAPVRGGNSPLRLLVPTLADELRSQSGGKTRVVTMAVKARAAIMLAGHASDATVWYEAGAGAWVTTSAFANAPVPFLANFMKAHPVERDYGKEWTRALPESAYLYEDAGIGEKPPAGWTATFPHSLASSSGKPDAQFYRLWPLSPDADDYMGEMAEAAVDALRLGKGPGTDYMAIGFDVLDAVGHAFGPNSHEVQDTLVRLDATIGKLLDYLDRRVGAKNYVLALSSDHGVAPIPERSVQEGRDAGRIGINDIVAPVEKALEPILGPGTYVARMTYPELYFMPGVYAKIQANAAAMAAVKQAILGVPGVWKIFRSEELLNGKNSSDPVLQAAARSYFPGRSGDLEVVPKPNWIMVTDARAVATGSATTHGTSNGYDQHVPVILFGAGIRGGEYAKAASPADIAPTLAALCGIKLAHADGKILSEAIQPGRLTAKKP